MQTQTNFFFSALIIALSIIAACTGLYLQGWHGLLPWSSAGLQKYIFILALVFSLYCIAWRSTRVSSWLFGVACCFLIAFISDNAWPLLILIIFALSSLFLGRILLNYAGYENWQSSNINAFLIGAGFYGTLTSILVHFPINYSGLYLSFLLLPIVISPRLVSAFLLGLYQDLAQVKQEEKINFINIFIMIAMIIHFIFVLMPEVGNDALMFHLFVATQVKSSHQWSFNPTLYAFALIPMLSDWLMSFAFLLGGEVAARIQNLLFTYVLVFQCYKYALWLGADQKAAKLAALIFLITPVVFLETNTIFVESVWAAYVLAAFYLLFTFIYSENAHRKSSNLVIAGVFLGLALTAKVITANIIVCFVPVVFLYFRAFLQSRYLLSIIAGLFLMLLIGVAPYIYSYIITSNPVFPFFNAVFKSPLYLQENFDNLLFKSGLTWDFIYSAIFKADKYIEGTTGAGGFQFLLGLPVALYLILLKRNIKSLVVFVFSVMSVAFIFHSQSYLRYVYPFYVLLTALIVSSLSPYLSEVRYKKIFLILVGIIIFMNAIFLSSASWCYRNVPLSTIFDDQIKKNFMHESFPVRQAIDLVNVINTDHAPVALITRNTYAAYLNSEGLYPNWYNFKFRNDITSLKSRSDFMKVSTSYNTSIFIVDANWAFPDALNIILENTELVFDYGRFSVRKLKESALFVDELLKNTEFNGVGDWNLGEGAQYDKVEKSLAVSLTGHAMQVIPVSENTKYLQEMLAACVQSDAKVRLQINWAAKDKELISASNSVFDCKQDWTSYHQIVKSPAGAAYAVVYVAAYDDKKIKVKRASFKN